MAPSLESDGGLLFRGSVFDNESPHLDKFGALLIVTSVSIVLQMLIDMRTDRGTVAGPIAQIAVSLAAGATVLLALRASGVGRRWVRIADILIVIGVGALVVIFVAQLAFGDEVETQTFGNPGLVTVGLLAISPVVVTRRLLAHRRPTTRTLIGAVAAYLLIIAAFASAFLTVDLISTGSFFGQEEPTTAFMYFSLVTATTLGYGDLAPATEFGRLLATTEAVVGQVFLVTFVAFVVGLLASSRGTPTQD